MKKGMILAFVAVLAAGLTLTSTAPAGRTSAQAGPPAQIDAGAPALLNYQGLLLDSAGNPVSNGSYQLTFAIYDVATAGTALWSETQAVTVTAGLFNATLGSVTAISDTTWVDGRELWLGVTLQGGGGDGPADPADQRALRPERRGRARGRHPPRQSGR